MVYTEYKQTGFYPERMFSMNKAMIFFGIAAAVGTGYILAKKYIDKNPEAVAAVKENCSDKLHKASVYCTGAVKTGSEKLTKSVNEIVSAGREKSAELMKKAATTGTAFKNEINNLKLNGEDIPVELKQGIYNDLFMTHRKVTVKQIKDYLKARGCYDNNDVLSGIDTTVKSSLKSYFDFKDFESLTFDDKESIIASSVIFGDDKKLLKKRLKKLFPEKLTDEDIKKICKLKYTGWSRLSKEFLCDVEFTYKKTGEVMNVITALWETNYNLMQILYSEDFCCDGDEKKNLNDKLDELSYTGDQHSLRKAVDALYVSPKVKRPILRALLIAKEIEKIQERPPKKIFVEVARGIDNREERHRASRKKGLWNYTKTVKRKPKNSARISMP